LSTCLSAASKHLFGENTILRTSEIVNENICKKPRGERRVREDGEVLTLAETKQTSSSQSRT